MGNGSFWFIDYNVFMDVQRGCSPPLFILSALLLPLSGYSFECKAVAASIFKIRITVPAQYTNAPPE
jgi:hypothetical protein